MAIPYTQGWAAGNSTFTSVDEYNSLTDGADPLYPEMREAEGVTVNGSGRLDWKGVHGTYQDAGIWIKGMGSLDGGGAFTGESGFWDGNTGFVECTYLPNATSLARSYAPLITIPVPNGTAFYLMLAYDISLGFLEVYRLRDDWVSGTRYRPISVPLPVADTPYKVKLCWKCGTGPQGSVASDGYIRVYINDVLEDEEANIPLYLTDASEPDNLIDGVFFGFYGLLGELDDITVSASACSANQPPVVDAGPDQTVALSATATLDGTVSDDGLPDPPAALTTTWSKTSGPGTVTFGNASLVDTTATFSATGTYVLRLTADDSELTAFDELTITVVPQIIGSTVFGTKGTVTSTRTFLANLDDTTRTVNAPGTFYIGGDLHVTGTTTLSGGGGADINAQLDGLGT